MGGEDTLFGGGSGITTDPSTLMSFSVCNEGMVLVAGGRGVTGGWVGGGPITCMSELVEDLYGCSWSLVYARKQ